MATRLPKITLIWLYEGPGRETRREIIDSFDYPDLVVIASNGTQTLSELAPTTPVDSEFCVFWADDGKPVGPGFLRDMIRPLAALNNGDEASHPDMHLWSGNALAMHCATFRRVGNVDFVFKTGTFLKMALLFLDSSYTITGRRAHVAFSSTERLVPMCAEPVGLPS